MLDNPLEAMGSATPSAEVQRQRDAAQRSLLRANTAVALVLLVVLALALAAVWLGWNATRLRDEAQVHQHRAEQAEGKARADLWRAYVSEAKATRLGNVLERRGAALESIRKAAAITTAAELRHEAVATLALPGFQLESSFPLDRSVSKFTFDPTLRYCALGLTNGDVVIRSLADGREYKRLRKSDGNIPADQSRPGGLEFSRDGRRLAVRYLGGAFAIWDLESNKTLFVYNADKQRHLVSNARFSSDGRFVVAPVLAPRDGMAVFEIDSGREVAFFSEFSSFRHASVRPGAPMFAANNGTNLVVINWDTGERVEFPFQGGIRKTAWTPDGKRLIIAGSLLDVHVWDFEQRTCRVFSGHKGDVWDVVVDPLGTRMATSSEDGTSRIWDLQNGRLLGVTTEGFIGQWSEDDRVGCARLNVSLDVRRLRASPVYQSLAGNVALPDPRILDISADGEWAASLVEKRGLMIWNLKEPGPAQWFPMENVLSVCFHPIESRLLVTRRSGPQSLPYSSTTNKSGVVFQLGNPEELRVLRGRRLDRVSVSANGRAFAWVELGGGNVWVQHLGEKSPPVRMLKRHSSVAFQSSSVRGAGTISLSPDGRWMAIGYSDPGVEICDAKTGESVVQLSTRQGNVQFSLDGRFLVVGEREFCQMFRVGDWDLAWEMECQPSVTSVAAAAFSPDSSKVAVANSSHSAVLLEVKTGRLLAQLEAPSPAPISAARWTPDGERLLFSTREGQLDVWRPASLQQELAAIGLGWDVMGPGGSAILKGVDASGSGSSPAWIGAGALATVILVSIVALLSLGRHRKLIIDFTRTEALAAQRERELKGEREVNRLKSSFVSMVSHEFRTPLGIIQSSAQILERYLDRLTAERRREQLVSINRNVQRMAGLIDEVLLLGSVEAGQMRFNPAPLDLGGFCRRLTDEMTSATHRRCPIRLTLESAAFPPAQADENLLRHILGNLISNATKYSPSGSDVDFLVARSKGLAVFTVRDHGIGIPVKDQSKLFVAFQRGSNVEQIHGTGLGLTIVKRCVELHQGEVTFTSEEGKGTTFAVRIPMFSSSSLQKPSPEKMS